MYGIHRQVILNKKNKRLDLDFMFVLSRCDDFLCVLAVLIMGGT